MTTITRLDKHTFGKMLTLNKVSIIRGGVAQIADHECLLADTAERFAITDDENNILFVIVIHELSTWQAYELHSGYWWMISRGIVHMAPSFEFFEVPYATEEWYETTLKSSGNSVKEIVDHFLLYGMQYRYPFYDAL